MTLFPCCKRRLCAGLLMLAGLLSVGAPRARTYTGVIERGDYLRREEAQRFIDDLNARRGIDIVKLRGILAQATKQPRILELVSSPAEGKPWSKYRPIFLNEERIAKGVEFWEKNEKTLARAERVYGVPPEIIVGIIGVETFYGTRMGRFSVLDALATLGFDYPPRSAFFLGQLEELILLAGEEHLNPAALKGSYAGAMGMGQFIPGSYRRFAVDFDNDGDRDLFTSAEDAIGSVANYFQKHGWRPGEWVISPARVVGDKAAALEANDRMPRYSPAELTAAGIFSSDPKAPDEKLVYLRLEGARGTEHWVGHHNFFVITEYNHSVKYALAVYQLGREIKRRRNR